MQIVEWYDELVRLADNPVASLNRSVAVGEADGGRDMVSAPALRSLGACSAPEPVGGQAKLVTAGWPPAARGLRACGNRRADRRKSARGRPAGA